MFTVKPRIKSFRCGTQTVMFLFHTIIIQRKRIREILAFKRQQVNLSFVF